MSERFNMGMVTAYTIVACAFTIEGIVETNINSLWKGTGLLILSLMLEALS